MASRKHLVRKLLKGLETGDPEAASVVNEAKYIQHNPQTHEGSEGLAALFARLSKTDPKITFVRVFEDGDYVFAHNEYDFASLRVAFEVFRFEGNQAVEHWDNIQPMKGPNQSGRAMLAGETEITDLDRTEDNRALAGAFIKKVVIDRQHDQLAEFCDADLIEHSPNSADGLQALHVMLTAEEDSTPVIKYNQLHKVLAEGNFVLCLSEGTKSGTHTSFYDLFRISDGLIKEHWDTTETIAARSEWKNENGKF